MLMCTQITGLSQFGAHTAAGSAFSLYTIAYLETGTTKHGTESGQKERNSNCTQTICAENSETA